MEFTRRVEHLDTAAFEELRRAARDISAVALVDRTDDSVTLSGAVHAVAQVQQALWIQDLTATEHGEQGVAAAAERARVALQESEAPPASPAARPASSGPAGLESGSD